jgi:hypothetical protein
LGLGNHHSICFKIDENQETPVFLGGGGSYRTFLQTLFHWIQDTRLFFKMLSISVTVIVYAPRGVTPYRGEEV